MISFVCPSCGEPYKLEFESLPDYEKMFCSKCNKKLLHVAGKIYIYAWETSVQGDAHSVACPHCLRHFEFPIKTTGVYPCPACQKPFYTTAKLPPIPENARPSEGMATADVKTFAPQPEMPSLPHIPEITADPDMPEPPTPSLIMDQQPKVVEPQPTVSPAAAPEATPAVSPAAAPEATPAATSAPASSNDFMQKISQLSEELARAPRLPELDKQIKVGIPRPKTGILGIFIGIAEKLCGN